VLPHTGTEVMEERPREDDGRLDALSRRSSRRRRPRPQTLGQLRLTPAEGRANNSGRRSDWQFGLAGTLYDRWCSATVQERFYTIVLSVPLTRQFSAHASVKIAWRSCLQAVHSATVITSTNGH